MELHRNSTRPELRVWNDFAFDFARAVDSGLRTRPKRIPAKFHYDERGSELFEEITRQPEYDLTRKEFEILEKHAPAILARVSNGAEIIELGPGSGFKAITLLRHGLPAAQHVVYRPLDVSSSAVASTCANFSRSFPLLDCRPLTGDFMTDLELERTHAQRVVLFLGSSIGNFDETNQVRLLQAISRELSPNDLLLVGFDLVRDERAMNAAYNDAAGVTEEFNYNLLDRMNSELGANFSRKNFRRRSVYDPKTKAVETHLFATRAHEVRVTSLAETFFFYEGEPLHIESSHKFTRDDIAKLARNAGFHRMMDFEDETSTFVDSLWRK